ncbi:hypothetical protein LTR20_007354 [Exophiala xenobiotica]|nr:hypothetical protein LTS06_008052 [Exophiala xenobiotica]KAK5283514.1 hypothetical protein LTR40_001657 [Exophiala xenobiotica]KAK5371038.1 hypothetical protein LTS13_006415 [Exophiala xenobiotica]KAK5401216.1 hypothetical protein LTR79_001735 [Exophiala xenobiotica]KAK5460047.1 hypothetical protein LTR20_007354 [Exophiala xenobiotica]
MLTFDWDIVGKQLRHWGQHFQKGKKLHYVEATRSISKAQRRGDKRGPVSATRRMLAQRDLQLDEEEDASGQPAIW